MSCKSSNRKYTLIFWALFTLKFLLKKRMVFPEFLSCCRRQNHNWPYVTQKRISYPPTQKTKKKFPLVNTITSIFLSPENKSKYKSTLYFIVIIIFIIINSLPTRKNMARWGLSQSPDCSFCLNPESLLHIVAVVVNSTLIASPGGTTQSLTFLPSHFNP